MQFILLELPVCMTLCVHTCIHTWMHTLIYLWLPTLRNQHRMAHNSPIKPSIIKTVYGLYLPGRQFSVMLSYKLLRRAPHISPLLLLQQFTNLQSTLQGGLFKCTGLVPSGSTLGTQLVLLVTTGMKVPFNPACFPPSSLV